MEMVGGVLTSGMSRGSMMGMDYGPSKSNV